MNELDEQKKLIKQQMKELFKSFKCGEITEQEYKRVNKSFQDELLRLLMIKNFIFSRRELKNV